MIEFAMFVAIAVLLFGAVFTPIIFIGFFISGIKKRWRINEYSNKKEDKTS